jgi:hypothetical protein
VRGADEPVCGAAHLTLPTLRLGPSLSPLKGGEGLVSAGIILVERDASRAIKFSSPDSPARWERVASAARRVRVVPRSKFSRICRRSVSGGRPLLC